MGKGSNRRQFNKVNERAFKERYGTTFKNREIPVSPRTVYVLKGKELVEKILRA